MGRDLLRIAGERRKGVPVLLAVGAVDGEDVGGAHGGLDSGGSDIALAGEGQRDLGPDEEDPDLEQVDERALAIGGLRAGTQRFDKVLAERDPGGNGVRVDARRIGLGGKQCVDVQGLPDRPPTTSTSVSSPKPTGLTAASRCSCAGRVALAAASLRLGLIATKPGTGP